MTFKILSKLDRVELRKNRLAWHKWNIKYPGRAKRQMYTYDCKRRYGVTVEQVENILANQNGLCAICKVPLIVGTKNTHVDHCHKSNNVRGILCGKCNKGIGMFSDDTTKLLSAINYLKKRKFILIISPFEKVS
jgi:Recombination endonuclease VII